MKKALTILGRKFNGLTRFRDVALAYARGEIKSLPYEACDTQALDYVKSKMKR